jgi:chromosome segregation ATPase
VARGITEEDVWAACDALLLSGARPTIERVRQHIGRGSPNTVSPYLDTWFKGLGRRVKDPAAFAAPPDVPDPILQAAKHFWEVALAETRRDFDTRLQDGLSAAVAVVEAEKAKTAHSNAAAFDAVAKASRMQIELDEQRQALDQVQQDLAAERARVDEVRAALANSNEHLRRQSERVAADQADLQRQLSASIERADAADRRVALELERERTARTKAERHAESAQRATEELRERNATAADQARMQLEAMRELEADLTSKLALVSSELALERQRAADLRASGELSAAEASAARRQVASLQASLDRLVQLMEGKAQQTTKSPRKARLNPPVEAGS